MGKMLDALVYRPNTIKQRQAQFQADQRFVFQKTPRARLYMIGFMSLFTVGTAGISTASTAWPSARRTKSEGCSDAAVEFRNRRGGNTTMLCFFPSPSCFSQAKTDVQSIRGFRRMMMRRCLQGDTRWMLQSLAGQRKAPVLFRVGQK